MGTIQHKATQAKSKASHAAYKATSGDHEDWVENFARFGIAAKGVVYGLLGTLAAMAAFNAGGQTEGKQGTLQWLAQQTFGQVMLGILAVGLLGYVVWRFYQAFADPEDKGSDAKGIARRIGYGVSGIVYGFLAFYAAKIVIDALGSSGGGGGNNKQTMVDKILDMPAGQWIIGAIALIIIGKGIYQVYRAVSGKFKEKLKETELDEHERMVYKKAGYFGYIARGIVFGIVGFFFMRASIQADPSEAGGTSQAFDFLQSTGGDVAMGAVAIGLLGYGVFMVIKARHRQMAIK